VDLTLSQQGKLKMTGSRSSTIGGAAVGNVITTGDQNKIRAEINAKLVKTTLPSVDTVDVSKELAQIRAILQRIGGEHSRKISHALDEALDEAQKPVPNKGEVGTALKRALEYAEKGNSFAAEVGKLAPHVTNAVAWLGSHWHQLLSVVGLSV
jgi:hypothetical protein